MPEDDLLQILFETLPAGLVRAPAPAAVAPAAASSSPEPSAVAGLKDIPTMDDSTEDSEPDTERTPPTVLATSARARPVVEPIVPPQRTRRSGVIRPNPALVKGIPSVSYGEPSQDLPPPPVFQAPPKSAVVERVVRPPAARSGAPLSMGEPSARAPEVTSRSAEPTYGAAEPTHQAPEPLPVVEPTALQYARSADGATARPEAQASPPAGARGGATGATAPTSAARPTPEATSAGSAGGSASVGGGSASVGGGSAPVGGGSASVGGGSASVGGGSASVGGGSASVGGSSASVGGGSASDGGGSASVGGVSPLVGAHGNQAVASNAAARAGAGGAGPVDGQAARSERPRPYPFKKTVGRPVDAPRVRSGALDVDFLDDVEAPPSLPDVVVHRLPVVGALEEPAVVVASAPATDWRAAVVLVVLGLVLAALLFMALQQDLQAIR
jgi:hypothetical protein